MAQSDQQPVGSPFGAKTDGAEVVADIDLAGKTAIVTGGYSGIGLETVRALAGRGAAIVVPVRDMEKAAANLAGIGGNIRVDEIDLGDIGSVRSFAERMVETLDRLDLLINNAGIMACPQARVGPGWESQFGVNHMGHFALTRALMPLLERTERARVVALSSIAHRRNGIRWDDIHFDKEDYEKWEAYAQAKTANALFANALSRRLKESGGLAFSVHPGGIFTPLQRHLPTEEQQAMGWLDENGEISEQVKDFFKTPEQGCSTTLWAATSALLDGKPGVYCEDCDIARAVGEEEQSFTGVRPWACDDEAAERLWTVSEEMLAGA
ncbi:MAG: SDR family NAD(P)-dependent oxidoreductase [Sphingomonadales bacterium]|nr:SDR family NAD(P)-dependent oxidoreductase [Sphingomonadales bacterium]